MTIDTGMELCVCGAHMSGLPLNQQLVALGAVRVRTAQTAPLYRFYALTQFDPPRPGLVRVEQGYSIDVEIWRIPVARFGEFMRKVPSPLCIGHVALADDVKVLGFLCEAYVVGEAKDISKLGGWRAWIQQRVDNHAGND